MSFTAVRPYFRAKFKALGFKEHRDNLNADVVPNPERAFHIDTTETIAGTPASQQPHFFDYPVLVTVFVKGKDETKLMEDSDKLIETILCSVLIPEDRLGEIIKDVVPDGITRTAIGESNDNILRIEFNFTVKLIVKF